MLDIIVFSVNIARGGGLRPDETQIAGWESSNPRGS